MSELTVAAGTLPPKGRLQFFVIVGHAGVA